MPCRELAQHIAMIAKPLKRFGLTSGCIHGGFDKQQQVLFCLQLCMRGLLVFWEAVSTGHVLFSLVCCAYVPHVCLQLQSSSSEPLI